MRGLGRGCKWECGHDACGLFLHLCSAWPSATSSLAPEATPLTLQLAACVQLPASRRVTACVCSYLRLDVLEGLAAYLAEDLPAAKAAFESAHQRWQSLQVRVPAALHVYQDMIGCERMISHGVLATMTCDLIHIYCVAVLAVLGEHEAV